MHNHFHDLTIGQKLNIGFGILVLLLLLIVGLIFAAGQAATNSINLTVDVRVPAALASARAQSSLLQMRAAVRGYLAVGDLQNIDDYNKAKELFQANLRLLKALSVDWSDAADVRRLDALINAFADWLPLPDRVFALHDNPLENQPALRLANRQVQPLSTALANDIARLIELQTANPAAIEPPAQASLLARLLDFQTSLQSMSTNLRAYAGTGDLVFKFGYAEQLVLNGRLFGELLAQVDLLDAEQHERFTHIATLRDDFLQLPAQIFAAVEGERSHEDRYLFQHEMEPQAEQMLQLLEALTAGQQMRLQRELNAGAQRLAGVQYQTLFGGFFALFLAILMAYFFRESIAGPIRRLNTVAQQLGAGKLDVQATVEHGDEIGRLATTFNSMTTRLHTMIDELAHARDVAETASRAKSDFLARMSHELRTPLNGILGYVQILARDAQLTPAQLHALTVMRESGEHLLTLINDVLDLAKIEAHKLELTPTHFALLPFLRSIVDMFLLRAEQKARVRFAFVTSPQLPSQLYADEQRLRQILINLLDNAFKFTAEGEITLQVTWAPTPAVASALPDAPRAQSLSHLLLTVLDTGPGIAPAQRATIFAPFEQVGERRLRARGVGLGLAIAQELAHAMGGMLTVESELGVGSQFTFALPIAHDPSIRAATLADPLSCLARNSDLQVTASLPPDLQLASPLPPHEQTLLLDLAHKGELPRLRREVERLAATTPSYQPLAQRLLNLIEAYDEEQILLLLQPRGPDDRMTGSISDY